MAGSSFFSRYVQPYRSEVDVRITWGLYLPLEGGMVYLFSRNM